MQLLDLLERGLVAGARRLAAALANQHVDGVEQPSQLAPVACDLLDDPPLSPSWPRWSASDVRIACVTAPSSGACSSSERDHASQTPNGSSGQPTGTDGVSGSGMRGTYGVASPSGKRRARAPP